MNVSISETKIIQIGGGNKIENSQGQIEENVIWLSDILRRSSDNITNYYASGKSGDVDVAYYGRQRMDDLMEPLSRIYEYSDAHRLKFKRNSVPNLSGSINKEELKASLTQIFKSLSDNDELLIIFNGHGGINEDDVRFNTLKLWGDERIDVGEIDALLDNASDNVVTRFVFPQCYSGGFYHLIFKDPTSSELAKQERCGFFAESPYEESEGCSLNTNKDEYRDYSTYFFAPLNGKTRSNQELALNADLNSDGIISFSESHTYTIMEGVSKDISQSTSEVYLEQWEPWFIRWAFSEEDTTSEYWQVAIYLSEKHNLPLEGKYLQENKQLLENQISVVIEKRSSLKQEIEKISTDLKNSLKRFWPELSHPYTNNYFSLLNKKLLEINQYITKQNSYVQLVDLQNSYLEQNRKELELERKVAQIDKILRMKKLSRIKNYFNAYASDQHKNDYQRLKKCEDGRLLSTE